MALLGLFPGFHIAQLSFQVIVNCGVNFLMQCDNPQKAKVFTFTDEVRFRIKFLSLILRWNPPVNCSLAVHTIRRYRGMGGLRKSSAAGGMIR